MGRNSSGHAVARSATKPSVAAVSSSGQDDANPLCHQWPQPAEKWSLDDVSLTLNGKRHDLRRAVDQDDHVLDRLVQSRRHKKAAKTCIRKLLKGLGIPFT